MEGTSLRCSDDVAAAAAESPHHGCLAPDVCQLARANAEAPRVPARAAMWNSTPSAPPQIKSNTSAKLDEKKGEHPGKRTTRLRKGGETKQG